MENKKYIELNYEILKNINILFEENGITDIVIITDIVEEYDMPIIRFEFSYEGYRLERTFPVFQLNELTSEKMKTFIPYFFKFVSPSR